MQKEEVSNWGNYPKRKAEVFFPENTTDLRKLLQSGKRLVPRGNGRSYGDSSLGEYIISSKRLDKFIDFDREKGILYTESGVLLSEILDLILPAGYFLPVTPGTKFISIGGAIAADVHGKNHHVDACFSEHLIFIDLIDPAGEYIRCSKSEHPEIFWRTVGGMGNTGFILSASFRLKAIESAYIRQESLKAKNLEEVMEFFEASESWTYTVAWIDCLQKGKDQGRSLLLRGEHAKLEELPAKYQAQPLKLPKKFKLSIPVNLPAFVLNTFSIKAFNFLYYHKQLSKLSKGIVSYEPFFYPLDFIHHWNRMYGKRGFTQYQFVLPKASSKEGLKDILDTIRKSKQGSFLTVLKLFGKSNSKAPHTFPQEGYTLAMDFPIRKGLDQLLAELDKIVLTYGGRLYLAKDAFMSKKMFADTYEDFPKPSIFSSDQQIRLHP
ncbi:MAG: FAD-binding oxidoreductase [Bacteroidota bacterium]